MLPLYIFPHPSLDVLSPDPLPSTVSGTLDCNMVNAHVLEPLPGLNLLKLPQTVDLVSMLLSP